jgi:phage protein D
MKEPKFKLEYEGKDITEDISKYATSISYTDAVSGESDEIQVTLQDLDGLWRSAWRPNKGDKIKLKLGYGENLVDCGSFEVDEIELSGPPDTVNFRGLATPVTSPMRSQVSKAYENQTLRNIVQSIADKYGLTIQGDIPAITIPRVTQGKETDLAFLNRIAGEFLMLFSIRGTILTFTQITEIEKNPTALTIDRTDCISYSMNDKTVDVTNAVTTGGMEAKTGKFISSEAILETKYFGETVAKDDKDIIDELVRAIMLPPFLQAYFLPGLEANLPGDLKVLFSSIKTEITNAYVNADRGGTITRDIKKINQVVNEVEDYKATWKKYVSAAYGDTVKQATDIALQKLGVVTQKSVAYSNAYDEKYNLQTRQIADYRASALAYVKKTRQVTGRISVIGQITALAGNNFNLTGFGRYNGICHIEKSTHNISRGSGYVTDIEFKMVKQ